MVGTLVIVHFVQVLDWIFEAKIVIQVWCRFMLIKQLLLCLTLNRATRFVSFGPVWRYRIELFEFGWLRGKLLVLSCSVIIGVATDILLLNANADACCLQLVGLIPLLLVQGVHGKNCLIPRLRFLVSILFYGIRTIFLICCLNFTLRSRHKIVAHNGWIWSITLECLLQTGAITEDLDVLLCTRFVWFNWIWILGYLRICWWFLTSRIERSANFCGS